MEQKPCNPIVQNDKVKIALGCAQSPISIGKFTGSFKNGETNVYYNVDLGRHSKRIYNAETNNYEDLQNLHWSFHNSGHGHLKQSKGPAKILKGYLSDGSTLINTEKDPLILGVESFYLNRAPCIKNATNLKFLIPPDKFVRYSILWIFIPSEFPEILPQRMFWGNFWGYEKNIYNVRTASISDILISPQTYPILTVNGWSIRACFLKTLLPMKGTGNNDIILIHPQGQEEPWRAFTFIDAHLPLSNMIKTCALEKTAVLTTQRPWSSEASAHPSAWVKF